MFVYHKTKTGAFGINLDNVIDFEYDHKSTKLTLRYIDGRSHTTMDERFIGVFFEGMTSLEQQKRAVGVKIA